MLTANLHAFLCFSLGQLSLRFALLRQTDMLLECCNFGKVRGIQLLTLPAHYLAALREATRSADGGKSSISSSSVLGGAIGVTFETQECADKCASGLRDRSFDRRLLKTHVLLPLPSPAAAGSNSDKNDAVPSIPSAIPPPPPLPPPPRPPSCSNPNRVSILSVSTVTIVSEQSNQPNIEAISNDVDDFLSSLL